LLPAFTVLTEGKAESFSQSDRIVVLGYFSESASAERTIFQGVAEALRDDFTFGVVSAAADLKLANIKESGVILYKKFDSGKDIFAGKLTTEAITAFIEASSVPLMVSHSRLF
jgi:protein disulfide-isomerase A1